MKPEKAEFMARFGTPKQHEMMLNHPKASVRSALANDAEKHHLDKLVDDEDPDVRYNVATRGHKEHLDKLVHDPEWYVRACVIRYGNKQHGQSLLNDPHPEVSMEARRKLGDYLKVGK